MHYLGSLGPQSFTLFRDQNECLQELIDTTSNCILVSILESLWLWLAHVERRGCRTDIDRQVDVSEFT